MDRHDMYIFPSNSRTVIDHCDGCCSLIAVGMYGVSTVLHRVQAGKHAMTKLDSVAEDCKITQGLLCTKHVEDHPKCMLPGKLDKI